MPTASVDGFAQARALTKRYHLGNGSIEALRGVDLCVAQGEFVAIVGPSGCAKSTLLDLLGVLDTPTSGSVRLGGIDIYALDDDALTVLRRRSIGFVFQIFHLVPILTALDNVGLPLLIDGQAPTRYERWIHDLIELVGLGARAAHRPAQLSGGERQRVASAPAHYWTPSLK